jgi:hypothetical protein
VCGGNGVAIRESDMDWCGCWFDIDAGPIKSEEVVLNCSGVDDGASSVWWRRGGPRNVVAKLISLVS